MTEAFLLVGKVSKTHGLKGEVKVASFAESLDTFNDAEILYLKETDGSMRTLHAQRVSSHKNMAILSFSEIKSLEDAKAISGCELFIEKKDLPTLPEGEYYRYELIGLDVETVEGIPIGSVEDVLPTGSNDVLVVKKGEIENLVPMIRDVVGEVDLEKGKIIIEPFENMINGI